MSKPKPTSGLIQRWFGRPEPASEDAADFGTCMGLDLSLAPPPVPAPAAGSGRPRQGWTRRLRTRVVGP